MKITRKTKCKLCHAFTNGDVFCFRHQSLSKRFYIGRAKINGTCCFVRLQKNKEWMGLGDLIARVLGEEAKLGEYPYFMEIEIKIDPHRQY